MYPRRSKGRRRGFAALPAVLSLGALSLLYRALTNPPVPPVAAAMPLSIAVATADGAPAQTDAWIDDQIAETQRLYNGFGIYFTKAEVRTIDGRFASLENRRDRDALATQLKKGYLNVFIVSSLRDVDDPKLFRMGVHWAPNGDLKRQYCIVAASARRTTMAHEIGHYFGLQHTQTADNLMSYSRTGADVFMSATQKVKVTTNAKVYLARKELVP